MISKLFRSRGRASATLPRIPDGHRVYAIGDIHGCVGLLDELLEAIDADDASRGPAATTLIFLGDLVDRGPESAAVLDRLIDVAASGRDTRFLLGNHEEIFLGALSGDAKALRLFCRIGGRETLLSYGLDDGEYEMLDYAQLAERTTTLIPARHRDFLATFEDMVTIGDYLFVHAGVRPDTPLDEQRPSDLRWIRDPFLNHRGWLGKTVVHGHTVVDAVERRPHRIGIDTGAYMTGRLTALGLEAADQWELQTG